MRQTPSRLLVLLNAAGLIISLCTLSLLFLGHAILIFPGGKAIRNWLLRVDAAAWVQAVGSIGAILAAVYIAQWQALRTEKLTAQKQIESELVRLRVLLGILAEIETCCHIFRRASNKNFMLWYFMDRVVRQRNIIGRLPIFELPSTEAVDILLKAEAILGEMIDFGERYNDLGDEARRQAPSYRLQYMERISNLQARCCTEIENTEQQRTKNTSS